MTNGGVQAWVSWILVWLLSHYSTLTVIPTLPLFCSHKQTPLDNDIFLSLILMNVVYSINAVLRAGCGCLSGAVPLERRSPGFATLYISKAFLLLCSRRSHRETRSWEGAGAEGLLPSDNTHSLWGIPAWIVVCSLVKPNLLKKEFLLTWGDKLQSSFHQVWGLSKWWSAVIHKTEACPGGLWEDINKGCFWYYTEKEDSHDLFLFPRGTHPGHLTLPVKS